MGAIQNRLLAVSLAVAALTTIVVAQVSTAPQAQPAKEQAKAASPQDIAHYEKEILPILKANCYKCHGDDKTRGNFSMASRTGLIKGGDSGSAVDLDHPEESRLLKALNHEDGFEMPPRPATKLAANDIETVTKWVKAGIPGIDDKKIVASGKKGFAITPADRQYWAYRELKRPAAPAVKNGDWVKNPIDAFILSKIEAKGLAPAPPADRHALARRVYFDLIGLPPTPDEVDAFVNDKNPNAYERLIDKLLASPHYGEKWARHWLDLVRFAETNGFEFDQNKPMVWRYRDYVIDAFNNDKPYDQFVREQIAGDLLPKANAETMIATGFFRLNQYDTGAADRVLQKYEALDSIVSTTGQVFMGMSIGCARCHDHKADPIGTKDYYRLLGFFHNFTDLQASKTKRVMAPAEGRNEAKILKEKQDRELDLARKIYQLEQKFAVALAEKKGLKATDLPASDMIELSYRFYRDTWETLPDFDSLLNETEGPIAHNYFSLAPALHSDAMGFVFDGKLKVLEDGEYKFYLESTEGARLIIDGHTVIDQPAKGKHQAEGKAKLTAGMLPVRLEYFNRYNKPLLKVEWSGPGVTRRPLTEEPGRDMIDIGLLILEHGAEVLGEKETHLYAKLVNDLEQSRKTPLAKVGIEVSMVSESGNNPTYVLIRGNPKSKGDRVDPGFPEVLVPGSPKVPAGGRLALANWLTDPKNPVTSRVMVNRLWQHHFGRGLVPSPNDFGKFGEAVTHPELVDWLASEFIAKGWKIKDMHRMLMTSNTYLMSAKTNEKAMRVDPGNLLFWHHNMRRLSAEEIRDSVLAVSGKLNFKMGGPSIYPKIPKEVLAGQARPGQGWGKSSDSEASRRSIYVFTKRSLLVPILAQFDQADTDQSCPVRFTTTVPTQALGMLNDEFSNEHAKVFASRLVKELPNDVEGQVKRAIRLTTGRVPTEKEVRRDVEFIEGLRKQRNLLPAEALRIYCLMVINTNEFIYLD